MATSIINLYRTPLTPERNAVVDDLEQFLNLKCTRTYHSDKFQYIKIGLNIRVNISHDQEAVGNQSLGNYCEIIQDNMHYYYFIVNANWTSSKAVKLDLSLDTINTYRDNLEFLSQTTIQRQHGTRLALYENEDTKPGKKNLVRIIDRVPENIVLSKELKTRNKILEEDNMNWYLIYKTREDLSPTDISNPVSCLLLAENRLPVLYKGSEEDVKIFTPSSFGVNKYYYLLFSENVNASIEVEDIQTNLKKDEEEPNNTYATTINKDSEFVLSNEKTTILDGSFDKIGAPLKALIIHVENDRIYVNCDGDNVSKINTKNKKSAAFEFNCKSLTIKGLGQLRYSSDLYGYESIPKIPNILYYGKGSAKAYTISIKEVDKADPKLMKIIRLPYAPCEVTKTSDGLYQFPDVWYFENGYMKLNSNNLSTEFLNRIDSIDLKPLLTVQGEEVKPNQKRITKLESKLYNSEFFTYKFVYDSFSKPINLENYNFSYGYNGEEIYLPVNFKPTNTINSKFAFNFETDVNSELDYIHTEDYEDYMIVTRNNEEAIFNNAYINYINNGYNYDKKNANIALGQNIAGILLGVGQVGANIGVPRLIAGRQYDKGPHAVDLWGQNLKGAFVEGAAGPLSPILGAAAISAGFNAANGIVSTITSHIQAQDSIERKLNELSRQSTSVSGSDDVDLLQYYNGNKLEKLTYGLKPLEEKSINNLFFYTGYSHPTQDIPNTNSRYWFNFVQCTPVFKNEFDSVYSNYLTDIKTRFEQGVTIFHHHPEIKEEWDINQEYENWETSILDTSYLPTDKYTYLGINNVVKTGSTFTFEIEPGYEIDGITSILRFIYTVPSGRQLSIKITDPNVRTFMVGPMKANTLRVVKENLLNDRLSSDVTPLTYIEGESNE